MRFSVHAAWTLEATDGRTFGALPPFQVSGTVEAPVLARPYGTIVHPDFVFDRTFAVAPYYADVYPSLGVVQNDFFYDPFYFERQYAFWRGTRLPTPEMLSLRFGARSQQSSCGIVPTWRRNRYRSRWTPRSCGGSTLTPRPARGGVRR